MENEDLGMLFIPELHVLCKIYRDSKGMYIRLPDERNKKAYLEEAKNQVQNTSKQQGEKQVE